MVNDIKPTYEESIAVINQEIAKRRSKWKLTAIPWMNFDDVEQIVRLHVFQKWEQWDHRRPLLPWLNMVIHHRIINIVRSVYSNHARPCLKCEFNLGNNLCKIYGKQSTECPEYKKWSKSKKHAYDIKLPVSMSDERIFGEGNQFDAPGKENEGMNFDKMVPEFHAIMEKNLTPLEWKIYNLLFIKNYEESEVIQLLGYKNGTTKTGYKLVKKIRSKIMGKARQLIKDLI